MKSFVYLLLLVFCFSLVGQKKINVPSVMSQAYWGAHIVDLESGEVLISENADKSFVPASLTKLVTTATAMEKLGPDYTFMTLFSYHGDIVEEKLHGDLVVTASGDPSLCSEYVYEDHYQIIKSWVQAVLRKGVKHVSGDLIIDASIFDNMVLGDKWIWEDVGNYYGAGVYGLAFLDNRYYLTLKSGDVGELAEVVGVQPEALEITFDCQVKGANNNRDNAYIYGSPWTFNRRIRGTIPAHRQSFVIKGAMPNPPYVFGHVLKSMLSQNGVFVNGDVKVAWMPYEKELDGIAAWFSPKLKDLVAVTNKESNNLYAEHLLKILARGNSPASVSVALDSLTQFWKEKGLNLKGVNLYDGSGLSRTNLLTPNFVVEVLQEMKKSAYKEDFKSSLAVAGVDGTFKYFLDGTILQGKVLGKSGGMSGVRCYAGYAFLDQKECAFCVMVNNSIASMAEMTSAIEDYLLQVWRKS